jgi:hypothetical protein
MCNRPSNPAEELTPEPALERALSLMPRRKEPTAAPAFSSVAGEERPELAPEPGAEVASPAAAAAAEEEEEGL